MHNLSRDGAYCGISRGALDWSEFDPGLLAAELELRDRADPDLPSHPNQCGPCADCAEAMRDWGARQKASLGLSAPTREKLLRHAERFGPECVAETAREFGVDLRRKVASPRPRRQRRTTAELRDQARALEARGLVPLAIANVLNVSDRRLRALLA